MQKIKRIINKWLTEIILVSLFIVTGIYMVVNNMERNYSLNKAEVGYSIGKITGVKYGAKTGYSFLYEFYIEQNLFEGSMFVENELNRKGKEYLKTLIGNYYLVKYSKENTKYNELLTNKIVSDSLIDNCLKSSWNTPPF